MTRDEAQKLWPIIQAFAEGKTVEYRDRTGLWVDVDKAAGDWGMTPGFGSHIDHYRIKHEPAELWATFIRPGPNFHYCTSPNKELVEREAKEHGTRVVLLREVPE